MGEARVDLLEPVRILHEHLTSALCEQVFDARRVYLSGRAPPRAASTRYERSGMTPSGAISRARRASAAV